ncbi:MAG: transcription antitermination factor NusB [bacterium]
MGKRATARRFAMQAVYQSEISKINVDKALENLFEEERTIEETREFSRRLAEGVQSNKEELDKSIKNLSKNWDIDRINMINKIILRLALYELLYEKDTPKAVVINEALELAKRYSDPESAKFINGILGSAVI